MGSQPFTPEAREAKDKEKAEKWEAYFKKIEEEAKRKEEEEQKWHNELRESYEKMRESMGASQV